MSTVRGMEKWECKDLLQGHGSLSQQDGGDENALYQLFKMVSLFFLCPCMQNVCLLDSMDELESKSD